MLAWYALAVALLLCAALTFSRAGALLAMLATGGALLVAARLQAGPGTRRRMAMPLLLALLAAGIAIANYAWRGLLDSFDKDPLADLRWQYLDYGRQVVAAWLPWGSGMGSFPFVYAPSEPVSAMGSSFALHAHNDVLEVAVELGIPGLLLVAAFLALFMLALRKIRLAPPHARATLAAAALAVAGPLLHSLIDYPLRTLAVATLFALVMAQLLATGEAARNTEPGSHDAIPG
jgi:O-antigen ligase